MVKRVAQCKIHHRDLICPSCVGARGGQTAKNKTTHAQRKAWGKTGGRKPNPK